jgi:hypothetical protein
VRNRGQVEKMALYELLFFALLQRRKKKFIEPQSQTSTKVAKIMKKNVKAFDEREEEKKQNL